MPEKTCHLGTPTLLLEMLATSSSRRLTYVLDQQQSMKRSTLSKGVRTRCEGSVKESPRESTNANARVSMLVST